VTWGSSPTDLCNKASGVSHTYVIMLIEHTVMRNDLLGADPNRFVDMTAPHLAPR